MRIGELAKATGISTSAIRFYEKQGLLPRASRTQSGYRQYDQNIKARLDCIRLGQKLGFSLEELPKLLTHEDNLDHDLVLTKLQQKQEELSQLISKLESQKKQIEQLQGHLQTIWDGGECMSAEQISGLITEADL